MILAGPEMDFGLPFDSSHKAGLAQGANLRSKFFRRFELNLGLPFDSSHKAGLAQGANLRSKAFRSSEMDFGLHTP